MGANVSHYSDNCWGFGFRWNCRHISLDCTGALRPFFDSVCALSFDRSAITAAILSDEDPRVMFTGARRRFMNGLAPFAFG